MLINLISALGEGWCHCRQMWIEQDLPSLLYIVLVQDASEHQLKQLYAKPLLQLDQFESRCQ